MKNTEKTKEGGVSETGKPARSNGLKTEPPLSEKDEVKQAEDKLQKKVKKK